MQGALIYLDLINAFVIKVMHQIMKKVNKSFAGKITHTIFNCIFIFISEKLKIVAHATFHKKVTNNLNNNRVFPETSMNVQKIQNFVATEFVSMNKDLSNANVKWDICIQAKPTLRNVSILTNVKSLKMFASMGIVKI